MLGAFQLLRQIIWGTGLAMHIITIPGTFFHELAHQLACYLVGHRVLAVKYLELNDPVFAGYVLHEGKPGVARHLIIGSAPLLMGLGIWSSALTLGWYAARRRPFPVAGGNSDRSSLGHRGGDLPLRTEPSGYGECFSTTVLYALDSLLFDSCAHLVAGTELSGTRLGMDPVAGGGGAGYGVCSIPVGNPRLPPVCDSTPHVITDRPSTFPCGAGNTTSI